MNYELSFLTPILDSTERDKLFKEIEEKIIKLNGKTEDKFIEKKFFAYPVKKHYEGFLGQVNFSLEQSKIKEFQRHLKTKKEVIRILLEKKRERKEVSRIKREKRKTVLRKTPKREKAKIEELDKKLEEVLK